MIEVGNITNEINQQHIILKDDGDVTLVLRFHDTIHQWTADILRNNKARYGIKLAIGVRHIKGANMGIDLVIQDTSGLGIDPYKTDDFASGRCVLGVIDAV